MASTEASANSYIGCFLSILSKSEMRYAGVLYRIDPQDAVIGLANVRSFGTEGRRKDGSQVLPDDRIFDYVNFRGSDIKVLQVLSSEAQPEKVTSDLPDDPAIIQAYLLHSSSAPAITPQTPTISGPNSSSLGIPNLAVHQSLSSYQPIQNLTSFSSLLSTNALAAGQPMLLHVQEFNRSRGQDPYPQQQLLAGLPPGLAAYHSQQPMQHPVTNLLTMSVAATYGSSDSLKPPVVMDSLTPTPIFIPSDLPLDPALLIPDTLPNVARDLLSSSIMSMSSAAKYSSTAGLNISHIPQVIRGANFVQGSGLTLESLAQATSSMNESGCLNHMEDLKPSPKTPCQILQTGAHPLSSYHFPRSAHEDEEVVKFLTSESLPREPTGAQAPILLLPKPYAKKVYKGNLQNRNSITSKLAERGKRHKGAPQYIDNHKAYGEGKGEKMRTSNVQNPSDAVSKVAEKIKRINTADSCLQITKTKPWERENKMTRAESRTNQNTSILGKGGKKIDRADRQHHQTNKSISVGRGKKIPHLAAKYPEDFDFVAMNKKFNKDAVWGELGKQNEAHLKAKADGCDLPAEDDAEHVDAAMKLDKKPGHVKDDFFDSLSTIPPGPRKQKISEQRKSDMETFGYFQVHQRSHGSRTSRLGGNPKVFSGRRENGNAGRGRAHPIWSRVS
ncbi:protein decapping 5-like isoform X2 [Rhodamnia argentea]|uniref:Protein decapping 5-like isoform X2 n=1 Tax=Rhodamnia argentea TaxID=178133 RepID=A0ABM3HKL0_9MYRT|nr:protein decapping 5-like isoform X2 [Rhodamnia argentea]